MTLLATPATAHGTAHVHGVVQLEVAIDESQLALTLIAPQEALAGFEHPPRTDAQQLAARRISAALRDAASLFDLPAQAACSLIRVDVADAVLAPGAPQEEHPDIEATYRWRCASTATLRSFNTSLMTRFRGIRRLEVRVAGPRQSALRLSPPATRIDLSR